MTINSKGHLAVPGASREIFLGRQPILDRDRQLFAYELLFRSDKGPIATVVDNAHATATVIVHMVGELGLAASLGPYPGFINLDTNMLMSDTIELLPVDRIVLEILEDVEVTPALIRRCAELKKRGFKIALDDFTQMDGQCLPLLELVDIVKVDIQAVTDTALAALVSALKRWPARLLAEKVETEAQAQHCYRLGFDYFQGYFFARPAVLCGRKLSSSELALVRLLGLVLDDADTPLIEDSLKHEPALALNLLKLCNSAAIGWRAPAATLRQAISVLGRRQLQQWLQLSIYASLPTGHPTGPLLNLAATRGRLMECLASGVDASEIFADHAYFVGVLSYLPGLLGVTMEEIIAPLHLIEEVKAALIDKRGTLGALLLLAESVDAGDMSRYTQLAEQLPGITRSVANACLIEALAWAGSLTAEA